MSGHEENSIKEAGGCAAGFTGRFFNFNADAEARLAEALFTVGKFVQGESGCLLGHIKAAVVNKDGVGITLNLIDMDNGVEHHGTMPRCDEAEFNFMCAVLDVDEYELTHKMLHAIDDSGIDYFINKESLEHHHHHHDHEHGECDDPNCECHKHEHGECDDPECSCHHHHHHGEGECDDPECECHKHDLASMIDENGHFHHHHHHDHEHGECHCHDHDHEHHHHHEEGGCCCGHHHDDDEQECHCHDEKPAAEEKKKKGLFGFLKRK
ncbi:MAG: hydrogenase nickel incorporation protein HypA [archaeon]|nr:hydrogenase nickel incorporation protein HypA [archaeon]